MKKCSGFALLILFFLMYLSDAQEVANPKTTTIRIRTLTWNAKGGYKPLPGVRIIVTRGGDLLGNPNAKSRSDAWKSNETGEVTLVIPNGEPIALIFQLSDKYIPEIQTIATEGKEVILPQTLITLEDYRQSEMQHANLPSARSKITTAARSMMLPKFQPKEEAAEIKKYLEKMVHSVSPKTTLLIPAYFYPDLQKQRSEWLDLFARVKETTATRFVAVVNPASGPGEKVDPNYQAVLQKAQAFPRLQLIGYVNTDYGKIKLEIVKAQMKRWRTFYPSISGFFLDNQSDQDGPDLEYYEKIAEYAKELYKAEATPARKMPLLIGNPGKDFPEEYLTRLVNRAAVFFENSTVQLPSDILVPEWLETAWPERGACLPYNVAKKEDMRGIVDNLIRRNIGYIYVTDRFKEQGVLNPWSKLPGYWLELVTLVELRNKEANEMPVIPKGK